MPLSEHEQRLLDEMERNLYSSEADVVTSPKGGSLHVNLRGIVLGSIAVVVGLVALIVGVVIKQPAIGVLGFIVMALGVFLALRPAKSAGPESPDAGRSSRKAGQAPSGAGDGFSQTMQRRWAKRRGE